MSPAPTETATEKTRVHFSPRLGLKSLGASADLCLTDLKPMEQTNVCKGNNSIVLHTGTERYLQKNFINPQADCPSSPPYKSYFFLSDSGLNVQNKDSSKNTIEKDNCRQMFYTNADTRPLYAKKKVKRALFPGTVSQVLADVNKLWDLSVIEAEDMHGLCGPKYRLNGRIEGECLSIPLASNYTLPDLTDLEKRPRTLLNKECNAKSSFMRCLNRQQVLANRAKRNKKRLQLLLTSHVAEHCKQQISNFVSYQTRKANVSSTPKDQLSNDTKINHNAGDQSNITSDTCIHRKKQDLESLQSPSEVGTFSAFMPGILTSFERQLDSDATESSSDEDWDEKADQIYNCKAECYWLSMRANVGSRWTWLQAKISELEYQIQQLQHLQSQLRSQKGTLVFEEPSDSILYKETRSEDTALSSSKDLELSPSSPTMLLRNIEKQSAQLTEMVSSLMTSVPIALSPKPYINSSNRDYEAAGFPRLSRMPVHKTAFPMFNGFSQKQPKIERRRIHAKVPSTGGRSSARTRPLRFYHKRNLYRLGSGCTAMLSHNAVYCCNESLQTSIHGSTWTCCDKLQRPVLVKNNVCEIDPHFHPVLSLPSDLPLHLYFGALLRNNTEIRGDAVDNILFIQKEDERHPEYTNNFCPISVTPDSFYHPSKDERSRSRENDSDTVTLNSFNNATQAEDTSRTTPISQKSSSQTRDPSIMASGSRRRLRSESSYDIDNIVIPMNLVAPTKLEKLQYKEILTPSFKEMVYEPLETPPDEEVEDLSDDTYSCRHERYERREKARWSFWEQNNKRPKRSRSSCNGFAVWSGKAFPSNEENYSPGNVSPVSCDTPSPNTNETQNQQPSDELQHDTVEQWEQRVFPLTEAAALDLVNTHKSVKHTRLLAHLENEQQHSQTIVNNWL
ncbi:PREDICTED: KAT8 regulatory NSL complex subunit 1-like protein [Nanorana parkeri]|uniref:KAT8 regulatory NSL complex subunit 1-like protein n=1 Tax=Nanorana parkeri TaxID=125878 RepID=UPI00085411EF|nr:PREDICTED: KAT8 regulatory NSL complex subunit 1-like protein [Nanorana parkeri]